MSQWDIPPGQTYLGHAFSPEAQTKLAPDRIETQRVWTVAKWWLVSYKHGECSLHDLLHNVQVAARAQSDRAQTYFLGWVAEQALALPEPERKRQRPGLPRWQIARAVLVIEHARRSGMKLTLDRDEPGPAITLAYAALRAREIHFTSETALWAAYQKHRHSFDVEELEDIFAHDDLAELKAAFGAVPNG